MEPAGDVKSREWVSPNVVENLNPTTTNMSKKKKKKPTN
jgi:hypothetical protein